MNVETQNRIFLTTLLVIAAGVVGWLYFQLEWEEEEIDYGYTEEAQRNHFLAAEIYLNDQGIPTQSARGMSRLDELPEPVTTTLVMATTTRALSEKRLDSLWQWVEEGGHLVTNVAGATNVRTGAISDPLLAELGVEVYPVDENFHVTDDVAPHWLLDMALYWRGQDCRAEEDAFTVEVGEEETIQVALRPELYLVDAYETARAIAVNEHGPQLLQYEVGDGLVTVISELGLWSNRQISCYDNAYLLWLLSNGGEALILHHVEMPSLLSMMWKEAALAMVLLALLLTLWLWRRSRRFGPMLVRDETRRRSLLEHLHASAMFAWRNGHGEAMIEELQQNIRARMIRHHPGFSSLSFEEQCAAIAKVAQFSPESVGRVMGKVELKRHHSLVTTVQWLQTIRNRL